MSFASFLDSCASGTSHLSILRLSAVYALLVECTVAIYMSMDKPFAQLDRHPLDDYADHYPFALKGVPAIYMELDGDTNKNYHSPRDTYENFHASNYERIFTLVKRIVEES
mgnify:CR=1 FL=1